MNLAVIFDPHFWPHRRHGGPLVKGINRRGALCLDVGRRVVDTVNSKSASLIVALGKVASLTLLGATENSVPKRSEMTMSWLRRHAAADPPGALPIKLEPYTPVRFWPTYHPAYLLRRRNDKALHAEAWADLKRAVEGLR